MEHLTLALPDALFDTLAKRAQREGISPDEFVLQSLERTLGEGTDDPLLLALGTLESDTPDLGKRHDDYLAQAHGNTVE